MTEQPDDRSGVSKILVNLAAQPKDRVYLGDLVSVLGERAFGVLMLLLSLPNAVGLGAIPGLSTVFGVPQILISLQMVLGAPRPWLPKTLMDRSIAMNDFRSMTAKAVPYLVKIEKLLQPRLDIMSSTLVERILGVIFTILAIAVAMPIPFANQPPAIAQALISLGLIERDGVFIIIGVVVSILAVVIAVMVGFGILAGLYLAITQLLGL